MLFRSAIILLDAQRGRWDFPELKEIAKELYDEFDPDMVLIEQKASGMPLTQELRRMDQLWNKTWGRETQNLLGNA